MKLTKKMFLILIAGLGAGFLAVSAAAVWQMRSQSIDMAVDNYGKQMDSIAYAFSEIGSRDEFENLGDIAAEAYLKYQFRRCYEEGYALLKGDECLVNLTDYEILSPSELGNDYMIQSLGEKSILLMKREISQFPGHQVLMAEDITPYYQAIERRGIQLILFCGLILVLIGAGVFVLVQKALAPLKRLTMAAEKISEGSLDERVLVESYDEIGEFAEVFNQMAAKVERQVEDLQLLSGALAHEIKTPMTAVIGYSDSLLHVKLSEEQQKRALKQIHHAGLRLERLSSKMLNFLGAYENEEIKFEELSVAELFQDTIRETENLRRDKKITVEVEMGKDGPLSLKGDRELLLTLFSNLIHNAVKASETESRIWLKAELGVLSVRDEGCGISQKDLPHVTEAFYMADKSRSRSEGGSGLGLAICQRIALLHGMEMKIESFGASERKDGENTGGTEVFLYLPNTEA